MDWSLTLNEGPKYCRGVHVYVQGMTIVSAMTLHMPPEVFLELTVQASVGLFTEADHTTCFPEYEHLADRPECEGLLSLTSTLIIR